MFSLQQKNEISKKNLGFAEKVTQTEKKIDCSPFFH